MVSTALHNHSVASLEKLLMKARLVDQSVKGILDLKPWDELTGMILSLCNVPSAVN
jgi:hypothetical protein